MMCTMPRCGARACPNSSTPNSAQLRSSCATCRRRGFDRDRRAAEHLLGAGRGRMIHGGERADPAGAPAAPRWRSTREGLRRSHLVNRGAGRCTAPPGVSAVSGTTSWRSQTFSNNVCGTLGTAEASGARPGSAGRAARRAACRRSRASPTGPAVLPENRPKKACCSALGDRARGGRCRPACGRPSGSAVISTAVPVKNSLIGDVQQLARHRALAHLDAALARQPHHGVARDAAEHRVRQVRREQHAVLDQEQVLARRLRSRVPSGARPMPSANPSRLASEPISWLER